MSAFAMTKLQHSIVWILLSWQWQLSECNQFIPMIPEQCQNQNICEDVSNYPYNYVESIITELDKHGYIWQSDGDPVADSKMDKQSSDNHNNIVDICPSHVQEVAPLAAKDEKGQWYFVINQKQRVTQKFKTEVCDSLVVNRTCGKSLQNTSIHIKAYGGFSVLCRQEYLERVLSCLDERGKIVNKLTVAASCCSCAVDTT